MAGTTKTTVKVFVGGISDTVDESALKDTFANFGLVATARIMKDPETGKHRGFGFVELVDSKAADVAAERLNGAILGGSPLRVSRVDRRNDADRDDFKDWERPKGRMGRRGRPPKSTSSNVSQSNPKNDQE